MTEGIVNRFRTMAISRGSVLTGHVVGSMIQTLASVAFVIAVAFALGFHPTAGPLEWAGAIGLLALVMFALTWLSTAFGLVTKNVETASNAPLPLQFLPFLGSAIVPTDSMPDGMRQFAENQPFTPIIETLRGLLMGTHIGNSAVWAVGWCVALTLGGYL
jgi:ABC-2 type transport system permease protein